MHLNFFKNLLTKPIAFWPCSWQMSVCNIKPEGNVRDEIDNHVTQRRIDWDNEFCTLVATSLVRFILSMPYGIVSHWTCHFVVIFKKMGPHTNVLFAVYAIFLHCIQSQLIYTRFTFCDDFFLSQVVGVLLHIGYLFENITTTSFVQELSLWRGFI